MSAVNAPLNVLFWSPWLSVVRPRWQIATHNSANEVPRFLYLTIAPFYNGSGYVCAVAVSTAIRAVVSADRNGLQEQIFFKACFFNLKFLLCYFSDAVRSGVEVLLWSKLQVLIVWPGFFRQRRAVLTIVLSSKQFLASHRPRLT